jgi:hypothetical protein
MVDFLAINTNGDPAPHAQFSVGRYEADESGIVHDVAPNHAAHMLNSGCIPLPPPGWVDPRPVITVK